MTSMIPFFAEKLDIKNSLLGSALAFLSDPERHPELLQSLDEAGKIATTALELIPQIDKSERQKQAVILAYRYSSNFEEWKTVLEWITDKCENAPRSFDIPQFISALVPAPDYMPYWEEAKDEIITFLYYLLELKQEPEAMSLALQKSSAGFFARYDIPFEPPISIPMITCLQCGVIVPKYEAVTADRQKWFCSEDCASAYYKTPEWRNPRNW